MASKCKFCGEVREDEDEYLIFCDGKCQELHILGVERMKTEKINLPEELFKSWLEDETNRVDKLTAEEIQGRIMELEKIIFESKTRLSIAYQKRIKLMGSDWADNSKAISSPDFRVNYDKDPRKKDSTPVIKKTKEEKAASLQEAAGIDPAKLKEIIKQKMLERAKKPMVLPTKKEGDK
jgi:endogenous inhibitor of DNA gyrase (YacG/DUF329 family)